jgi:ABC-type Fe3+ transport system substrate-binding protein
LDEVYDTHVDKLGWEKKLADSFQNEVKRYFPEAMISGFEELIPDMSNDEKDRHVVAAAARGEVDFIITFNLKDFADKHLYKWGLKTIHPQDYLLSLYSVNPALVTMKLSKIASDRNIDIEDVILNFGVSLPKFTSKLMDDLGETS